MTDIVELLRNPTSLTCGTLHWKAADEIERLRAVKTPASSALLNITKACLDTANAEIKEAADEIERLRSLIASTRLPQCGCGRNPKTMSLLDEFKP